jgi:hypothetical protein
VDHDHGRPDELRQFLDGEVPSLARRRPGSRQEGRIEQATQADEPDAEHEGTLQRVEEVAEVERQSLLL